MAEITAALVKDLRERTGAGMSDCKKALVATEGDMEAAIDWLRTKGLASAAKKSGRVAAEGLVGVTSSQNRAAMVEVNSETDFVARNEAFQGFVEAVTKIALEVGDSLDTIKAAAFPGTGRTVAEELVHLVATVGENMNIRRAKVFAVEKGAVATYMHNAVKPGLGKIGVLVALESPSELDAIVTLGRQIGMHVAATKPASLDVSSVDPAALERAQELATVGAKISVVHDPLEAVRGAQALYTDVWASMGQEEEQAQRERAFAGWCLDEALLSEADPRAIVLHCLPAHRGEEISAGVIESSASRVFDQAENRLHAQQALLATLLGGL
jgi:elongation factor Ts